MRTFEKLEDRRPLAVTAVVNNGTLEIRAADAAANNLAFVGTGVAGEVVISGLNGTTVNGSQSATLSGVTDSLDFSVITPAVNRITIDNLYVAGFVHLGLRGAGNTAVIGANGPVSSGKFMWVIPQGSFDVVRMTNTHVNGSLVIGPQTGFTNDAVSLSGVSALWHIEVVSAETILSGVNANGPVKISGSQLAVFNSSTREYLEVGIAASIYVDTCYAGRYIAINNANLLDLSGSGGSGTVSVYRSQTPQLTIRTGNSDDQINLFANHLTGSPTFEPKEPRPPQTLYINTRGGNDSVDLRYNVVLDDIFAGLGAGEDTMTLTGNYARSAAYFDGEAADYPAQTPGNNRISTVGNLFGAFGAVNFLESHP